MNRLNRWHGARTGLATLVLAGAGALHSAAATVVTHDFDGLIDGTVLVNQLSGLVFSNAMVLTAGLGLNEFEFPPRSGANVLTDDGGPITIDFATPVFGVGGYFTHTVPLDLRFFDAGNNLLGSRGSPFDNNLAQSGDPGSAPNEFIGFSAVTASIARVVISGDRFGGSFTLDDLSIDTGATVPEPGTWLLAVALLGAGSLPGGWLRRSAARAGASSPIGRIA